MGHRPADTRARIQLAADRLAGVPQMVPVYAHRYLPAGRGMFGHPVLSIHQTDIICYGTDLVDYVYQEFGSGTGYRAHRSALAAAPDGGVLVRADRLSTGEVTWRFPAAGHRTNGGSSANPSATYIRATTEYRFTGTGFLTDHDVTVRVTYAAEDIRP